MSIIKSPKTNRQAPSMNAQQRHASINNLLAGRIKGLAANLKQTRWDIERSVKLLGDELSMLDKSNIADAYALIERLQTLAKLVSIAANEHRDKYRQVNNLPAPRKKSPPKVMEKW